jgi:hypothetical protein
MEDLHDNKLLHFDDKELRKNEDDYIYVISLIYNLRNRNDRGHVQSKYEGVPLYYEMVMFRYEIGPFTECLNTHNIPYKIHEIIIPPPEMIKINVCFFETDEKKLMKNFGNNYWRVFDEAHASMVARIIRARVLKIPGNRGGWINPFSDLSDPPYVPNPLTNRAKTFTTLELRLLYGLLPNMKWLKHPYFDAMSPIPGEAYPPTDMFVYDPITHHVTSELEVTRIKKEPDSLNGFLKDFKKLKGGVFYDVPWEIRQFKRNKLEDTVKKALVLSSLPDDVSEKIYGMSGYNEDYRENKLQEFYKRQKQEEQEEESICVIT